ncbi:signal peptidase I [Nocardioides rubriscoriae]|uniref:signal peptidase I n=1 Tax=Nocardioides rubriscoriae TaxID=642762 RepID=UPI0011E063D7|nr:signal peptidase I [Nocardioides rubriscoriae]
MRRLRELLLWAGAALGLLAIAAGLAVTFLGFGFLIFRSGSMSPEIPTGGIALSRSVDAADIEPGDVVSVTAANGERVTHRVVSTTLRGDEASLVLQGDANTTPDAEVYVVRSVERVVASAPFGGYVVAHLLTPPGLVALVCLSLVLYLSGPARDEDDDERDDDRHHHHDHTGEGAGARGRGDDLAAPHEPGGRHRGARRASVVALVAATLLGSTSATLASFTDAGTAATSTFQATSIATPAAPSVAQTSALNQAATVTWSATPVGPNGLTASSYDVLRYTAATGGTAAVLCAGNTSRTCVDSASPGLLETYYYAVRARYGTSWVAEGARQSYQPSLVAPVFSNNQPSSGTVVANDLRAALNCTGSAPACGTVSPIGATVTYSFTRVAKRGAECWTGALWATVCTGPVSTNATVTGTTWSLPGIEDNAWPSGDNDRGTYTLKVTATNTFGSSSQTITVTIL